MTKRRVVSRTTSVLSPWVRISAKEVAPENETYHSLAQADYVTIVARLPDGRIPVVRQFRPAVEAETWELPAGLVEPGESAVETARRELREETGLVALTLRDLGSYLPDTARLENRSWVVAAETGEPAPSFTPEAGMELRLLAPDELRRWILDGTFSHQLQIAALALAALHGFRTGIDW